MTNVEKYLRMEDKWSSIDDEQEIEKLEDEGIKLRNENFTKSDWEELIAQSYGRAKYEYTKLMKEKFPDKKNREIDEKREEFDVQTALFLSETEKLGLTISLQQLRQFENFFKLVDEKNKIMNLTSITKREDFFTKHLFDSVLAHDLIPQNSAVIDLGCGGGFPSIPLKIARPDLKMTAMDATNKKVEFVKSVISELGLTDTFAMTARAEDAGRREYRENFDVVVSRAVASLPQLLELALPLAKVGGVFIAYKTDASEAQGLAFALKELSAELEKTVSTKLPNDDKRCLFVFRKTAKCSEKYPRSYGQIKKKPL